MKLHIVIVNYGCSDLAVDTLRSLESEIAAIGDAHVTVTDNQSPDDSVAKLRTAIDKNGWQSWCTLLPLEKNGGFAYGNNGGIAPMLKSENRPQYVLLLNPDTVVRPGGMTKLVEFMDANPKVGIAGSRLEDPDGTPQKSAFKFPSIASEFDRGIRLGVVSKLLAKSIVAQPVPDKQQPCDWVAGASMIVRREVFDAIGLMDEKYFMYFEETDFCRLALKAGWPTWYVPESRVVHLVGSVSQLSDQRKHRKRRPKYWFESRRRYFVKNHGWIYAALTDLAFVTGFSIWRLRRLVQRKADTDPPRFLLDSIEQSVFFKRASV